MLVLWMLEWNFHWKVAEMMQGVQWLMVPHCLTGGENYLVGVILYAILGSQGHINDILSLRSPRQEFCSPSYISLYCRRALLSHSLGSWGLVLLGVQGECEVGANGERKGEGLVLACQRMAEIHALGRQRGIHRSHFLLYPRVLHPSLMFFLYKQTIYSLKTRGTHYPLTH